MSVVTQKKKVKLEDLEELVATLEKIYLDEETETGKAQMDGKP
jgi:hypothetical protein